MLVTSAVSLEEVFLFWVGLESIIFLTHQFPTEPILLLKWYLAMSEDHFDCYDWGRGAAGIQWVEAGDVTKHPTVPRTAPQQGIILPRMSVVPRLQNVAVMSWTEFPYKDMLKSWLSTERIWLQSVTLYGNRIILGVIS